MVSISRQSTNYQTEYHNNIFSAIDIEYDYIQFNLHPNTLIHRNFNFAIGEMTGTYKFNTGFYGISDMPTEIKKPWIIHFLASKTLSVSSIKF